MNKEDFQQFFDKSCGPRKGECHDCKGPVGIYLGVAVGGRVTIKGGALYSVQTGSTPTDRTCFFKCDKCLKVDPVLRNFRPCEVYTHSAGYLRPINQIHKAKVREVTTRSKFRI